MLFVLKILMFGLAYKLYLVKREPYFSALLFSVPLAIAALIAGHPLVGVFVGSAILFALAFLCFVLLAKVPNGAPHYSIVGITLAILIFLIKM